MYSIIAVVIAGACFGAYANSIELGIGVVCGLYAMMPFPPQPSPIFIEDHEHAEDSE